MQHVGSYFLRPGVEPVLSVLEGRNLNQWTPREFPQLPNLSRLALHHLLFICSSPTSHSPLLLL